jgi:uncharacterized radical SAM protein YgiQ
MSVSASIKRHPLNCGVNIRDNVKIGYNRGMFLPTTLQEIRALGWDQPDIILVTGDAYIDSPHIGVAVIGKYLLHHGFRTAIIAQPSTADGKDIMRLGEPKLFWGVTGGSIDSMVANYTPSKKRRKQDDYTPGGVNIRPDRSTLAYTNLIRHYSKSKKPVVLGGLEASLRRIAHYDYWDDALRRSILFDAKADILAYGMAEKTVVELAEALQNGAEWRRINGICYISKTTAPSYTVLPSFEAVKANKQEFLRMFRLFSQDIDNPAAGFVQQHGDRFLIHNPPSPPFSTGELDAIYALHFERDAHPYYKTGEIRALRTIRQSITTHRGCFGRCSFCAIAAHQGRRVVSRSIESIAGEAQRISRLPLFNGIIYDIGGPTANMYGAQCTKVGVPCPAGNCLIPGPCKKLRFGHDRQIALLQKVMAVPGIKKVFVSSGIRHDLVMADRMQGKPYVEQLVNHHVSGQIKLAPEHCDLEILSLMNKPSIKTLMQFKDLFDRTCRAAKKRHFMTYYLMAAHPGCTLDHMMRLRDFLKGGLKNLPDQVQIFTPTPSTLSAAMYYCETDPAGHDLFCEKDMAAKERQKDILRKSARNPQHTQKHHG